MSLRQRLSCMEKLHDRGVYLTRALDEYGYRYLIAVDSHHRVIRRHRIFNPGELDEQTQVLARWLEREDPLFLFGAA